MITLSTRCHCGTSLILFEPCSRDAWAVECPDCVDPAEDASPGANITGRGETPEDALQHWFDRREELCAEPALVLGTLHSFVVPKSPDGWGLSDQPGITHPFGTLSVAQAVCDGDARHRPMAIYFAPITQKVA